MSCKDDLTAAVKISRSPLQTQASLASSVNRLCLVADSEPFPFFTKNILTERLQTSLSIIACISPSLPLWFCPHTPPLHSCYTLYWTLQLCLGSLMHVSCMKASRTQRIGTFITGTHSLLTCLRSCPAISPVSPGINGIIKVILVHLKFSLLSKSILPLDKLFYPTTLFGGKSTLALTVPGMCSFSFCTSKLNPHLLQFKC